MKKTILPMLAVLLLCPVAAVFPEEVPAPTLARFDEEVAVCRRLIRRYCAIAQEQAAAREADPARREEALKLLAESRKQWEAIRQTYSAAPPAEYASDKQFAARLGDIANALEDMETFLAAGDPRRSFLACGFGCGLFVTLHEENGLSYPLDRLFHLRKAAKTAAAVYRVRGFEGLRPLLPELLRFRDGVLLADLPWPEGDERNREYGDGVEKLSRTLDELTRAAAAGNGAKTAEILNGLVPLINRPYGAAL